MSYELGEKLVIAIKKENYEKVKEIIEKKDGCTKGILTYPINGVVDQTVFSKLIRCKNHEIIDLVLDHGWELRYRRDFDILKNLTEKDSRYETAVKILEHPNVTIGIDCLKYFKAKGKNFADQRISDLVDYLNAAAEIAYEQKELDAARKVIKKHAGQIKNLEAKQSQIAEKGNLSAEFLKSRKVKTKDDKARRQEQQRKESRLGI